MLKVMRGVALTPVTPLKTDGVVDDDGIRHLVDFFLKKGLTDRNGFLVPLSTTGNFLALSLEEKKKVVRIFLEACSGRLSVVVGCNNIRLADTIELAKFAQDNGAIGIMVGPPFYWKATDAQILKHYEEICHSVNVGVIIYNNHWASQVDISVEILDKILENTNVVALKECTYSIDKLIQVTRRFARRINVLSGPGEAYEPLYSQLGCVGFTSTLGNIIPEMSVKLYTDLLAKRFEDADRLARQLVPLTRFMDGLVGGQYISGLMYVLDRLGICEPTVRPPLLPLQQGEIKTLERIMKELGSWMDEA
jgi:4-hydroxy-tetrahydrodipicolinate synthase